MLIREGTVEDYYAIEKIAKQVQELHVELRSDIYHSVETVIDANTYGEFIRSKSVTVVEQENKTVGFMISYIREINAPALRKRKVLFIDSIAVLDGYRGEGIGTKLLEYAKNYAREHGLQAVELQVNAKNKNAYHSYINNGFIEKSVNMEYKI